MKPAPRHSSHPTDCRGGWGHSSVDQGFHRGPKLGFQHSFLPEEKSQRCVVQPGTADASMLDMCDFGTIRLFIYRML